jgi:hypothetical protein
MYSSPLEPGRTEFRGEPAWQLPEAVEHHWNKSEIRRQLTQVSTHDSLQKWRLLNVNRKSVSPAATK